MIRPSGGVVGTGARGLIERRGKPQSSPDPGPRPSWHGMDAAAVTKQLDVDPDRGLTAGEAAERLRTHGPNKLAGAKKESGFQAFLRQYQDFMQIILLGAAIVNALVTDDAGHDGPAGGPDRLQRRDRPAPGGQGRGERRGARRR